MVNAPPNQPNLGSFPIPPVAVARHPAALLSPRDLRHWVESLPLGNPPKAAEHLLHQLRLLVRDPSPGQRFAVLLALYDQPIDQLLQIVRERLKNNPDNAVPLDQLEHLTIELLNESAYGQLRMANELLESGKAPQSEELFRAMTLLDSALNIERLHYCRLAPQAWGLLLHIFLLAEHLQLADQPMPAVPGEPDHPRTIRGLFSRVLVITLCDPHQHLPVNIQRWHAWTGANSELLELTLLPQGAAAIPVDISGSQMPLAAARRSKPGPGIRYLASDRFMQQLADDPAAPQGLLQAFNDLIKGRKTSEQRQSPRRERNHPFLLLHGLHSVHRRLTQLTDSESPSRVELSPVPCRQINQSPTGAAFTLQGPLNPPLSVGEPILVEADAAASRTAPVGFAGRIQRLVTADQQRIEIGVEKLQGRLIPVAITGSATERTRGTNYAVLQQATEGTQHLLLAASSLFRAGDLVVVEGAQQRYNLRMLTLIAGYQRIAYIVVEIAEN
ncbi:MAG: hypothetical protein WBM65_04220 [Sedimenticolaceae bacterium]